MLPPGGEDRANEDEAHRKKSDLYGEAAPEQDLDQEKLRRALKRQREREEEPVEMDDRKRKYNSFAANDDDVTDDDIDELSSGVDVSDTSSDDEGGRYSVQDVPETPCCTRDADPRVAMDGFDSTRPGCSFPSVPVDRDEQMLYRDGYGACSNALPQNLLQRVQVEELLLHNRQV